MKIKCLLTFVLLGLTTNANAVTAVPVGAIVASQGHVSTPKSHPNTFVSGDSVLVPCRVTWTGGGFFEKSEISRELTLRECSDRKEIFEKINGVKYKFGKAKGYNVDSHTIYIELIEESKEQP